MKYTEIINYDALSLFDCEFMFEHKNMAAVIENGHVTGFTAEEERF